MTAMLMFSLLWSLLVYLPICHWVWGGGWLAQMGLLDFAGGTVIHLNSGIAALLAALFIGKRRGYGRDSFMPHNLGMTVLGAGILWFGWFGFNPGSTMAAVAGDWSGTWFSTVGTGSISFTFVESAWGTPRMENFQLTGTGCAESGYSMGAPFDINDPIFEINMGSSVYSTPIVANDVIYITTKDKLFAISAE